MYVSTYVLLKAGIVRILILSDKIKWHLQGAHNTFLYFFCMDTFIDSTHMKL